MQRPRLPVTCRPEKNQTGPQFRDEGLTESKFELIAGDQVGGAIKTPLADSAGIDVDKVGVRVVADASATQT